MPEARNLALFHILVHNDYRILCTHEGLTSPGRDTPKGLTFMFWFFESPLLALWCIWFPELRRYDTQKKRCEAWVAADREAMRQVSVGIKELVIVFGFIACAFVWAGFLYDTVPELLAYPLFLLAGIPIRIIMIALLQGRIRRILREQLIEYGWRTCMACGYNLEGNESGRCSECGNATESR